MIRQKAGKGRGSFSREYLHPSSIEAGELETVEYGYNAYCAYLVSRYKGRARYDGTRQSKSLNTCSKFHPLRPSVDGGILLDALFPSSEN